MDELLETLIAALRQADDDQRDEIKAKLIALAKGEHAQDVRSHLERAARREVLEVQWELEEVLDASAPPKAAPPPPPAKPAPPAPPDANKPLTARDLDLVYQDPRGLALHKTKVGERWFATQIDPRSGQPQTFELHPSEVSQLKMQLAGSPYWKKPSSPLT